MPKLLLLYSKLWWLYGLGLMFANLAYITSNFFCWLITLSFFLFVPGYLLLLLITKEVRSRWEIGSLALALSVLLMMVGGLLLNSLHMFGVQKPLTTVNVFAILDAITFVLLLLNRKAGFSLPHDFPHPPKEQIVTFLTLTLLPILAIGGAIRLNNGASNILTMILFAVIAILFIVLVTRNSLQSLYPYAIVMMGLSILFTTSLRGWFITGHDIQNEYHVFQLTSRASYWNIAALRNPYNACLSITILPTIIAKITSISNPYIYKVVFQMIFAFGLTPVYFFMKRLSNSRTAFMGAFLFISFPTFLNDMPFLNRQEIGFLFFGILMLITFLPISRRPKTILTVMSLLGLVLSHYSSSYVTLGIIILSGIIYKLLNAKHIRKNVQFYKIPLLSLPIVSIALLFTFLWNSQITVSTTGLERTLTQTVQGLLDHSSAQSGDVSYSLLNPQTKSPPELLAERFGTDAGKIQYVGLPNLPITTIGKDVSKIYDVVTLNEIMRAASAKILQLLLLVGVVVLWFRNHKMANQQDKYYFALALSFVVLLVLQTLLPQLSVDYGTLRFFQQALVVLSIPIVLGTEAVFRVLPRTQVIMVMLFALLFLDLSGYVPQIFGGYPAQLALNNAGGTFEQYYVHAGELKAATWLSKNKKIGYSVGADEFATIRFLGISKLNDTQIVSPFSINNGDYLYNDAANKSSETYQISINSTTFGYQFINRRPLDVLYANNESNVSRSTVKNE